METTFSPGINSMNHWQVTDLLTLGQAVERIFESEGVKFGESTLRAFCQTGELTGNKPGGCGVWFVSWGDVMRWRLEHPHNPHEKPHTPKRPAKTLDSQAIQV